MKSSSFDEALTLYDQALAKDPSLAKDLQIASDIRKIALDARYTKQALDLAISSLGANGGDVAYDVWSSTRSDKERADVNKLAKTHVDGTAIRKNASPALLVALDLAKSKSCGEYSKLLPKARENADARSLTKLKSLRRVAAADSWAWAITGLACEGTTTCPPRSSRPRKTRSSIPMIPVRPASLRRSPPSRSLARTGRRRPPA
jgi:hypothetical protein